jgi:hypothetical protein
MLLDIVNILKTKYLNPPVPKKGARVPRTAQATNSLDQMPAAGSSRGPGFRTIAQTDP